MNALEILELIASRKELTLAIYTGAAFNYGKQGAVATLKSSFDGTTIEVNATSGTFEDTVLDLWAKWTKVTTKGMPAMNVAVLEYVPASPTKPDPDDEIPF